MFTGPVGPVEVFFYWPEAVFGNFYWPGAIGSPLASSPVTLLGFTYELRMILQSIQRRAVGSVLIYICPSNNVPTMLLPKKVHCNRQTAFGC